MAANSSELLALLKSELNFLEQGGYGRSVHTPQVPTTIFRDSTSCLNFNDPARPHPCSACELTQLAPADKRNADMPCHHIVLDPLGHTLNSLDEHGTQQNKEEALATWLRSMIARLEKELAGAKQSV